LCLHPYGPNCSFAIWVGEDPEDEEVLVSGAGSGAGDSSTTAPSSCWLRTASVASCSRFSALAAEEVDVCDREPRGFDRVWAGAGFGAGMGEATTTRSGRCALFACLR
jgi:hypothetical protein